MIVFIKLTDVSCYEDYSDSAFITVNDDYVSKIQTALEGWRLYFNNQREMLKYEDQMFFEGYDTDNITDYQQFVLDHQKHFDAFEDSHISCLDDFIDFFNYVYPDAEMELFRVQYEFEIDVNE